MKDPLPLTAIQEAILDFLKGRSDAVLVGAHAVNAYAGDPRATQDVDILSSGAELLAQALRNRLAELFGIAVRVRAVEQSPNRRVYQLRKDEGNRHLADIRQVVTLPPFREIAGIPVLEIVPLVVGKLIASYRRRGRPRSLTDARDLAVLLLAFPALKSDAGPVAELLATEDPEIVAEWKAWVHREILPEEDDY